mmetsp:Transcript_16387/g.24447  ORF Transcript_16387/g.24447 Transcript_16387/m.24447 type:complete len:275 (+) Transcript_16387:420-1244(+)
MLKFIGSDFFHNVAIRMKVKHRRVWFNHLVHFACDNSVHSKLACFVHEHGIGQQYFQLIKNILHNAIWRYIDSFRVHHDSRRILKFNFDRCHGFKKMNWHSKNFIEHKEFGLAPRQHFFERVGCFTWMIIGCLKVWIERGKTDFVRFSVNVRCKCFLYLSIGKLFGQFKYNFLVRILVVFQRTEKDRDSIPNIMIKVRCIRDWRALLNFFRSKCFLKHNDITTLQVAFIQRAIDVNGFDILGSDFFKENKFIGIFDRIQLRQWFFGNISSTRTI